MASASAGSNTGTSGTATGIPWHFPSKLFATVYHTHLHPDDGDESVYLSVDLLSG